MAPRLFLLSLLAAASRASSTSAGISGSTRLIDGDGSPTTTKLPRKFAPRSYWRFENSTDWPKDTMGVQILHTFEGIGRQGEEVKTWHTQEDGGIVGGWVNNTGVRLNESWDTYWEADMGSVPWNQTAWTKGGQKRTAPGVTIEMLVKPGPCFGRGGHFAFFAAFPPQAGHACSASISSNSIDWISETVGGSTGTPVDTIEAGLHGTGVLATDYLYDGSWHHFAFVKDATTGDQAIWIDGANPAELRLKGNATGRGVATSSIFFNSRGALTTCAGIDELAVFEEALLAPDETVILLTPPVPLLGVSIGINRGCHQNDSLVNG